MNDQFSPLVTVVTPVYNQSSFVEATIHSVLAQTYSSIEYIVIDDGSNDSSLSIIQKIAHEFPGRFTVLTQSNMGQSATLNRGWKLARGKYLAYLSSDDLLYPKALEKLVQLLESNRSIVCAFPDSDLIDFQSRIIKKNIARPFNLEELIVRQECYIGPGALFRREAFDKIGGWDKSLLLAPDREFWIRLAYEGSFEFIPQILAAYRFHARSISYQLKDDAASEYIRVLDNYFNGVYGDPSDNIYRRHDEAYAYAKLRICRDRLRSGNLRKGIQLYNEASYLYPSIKSLNTKLMLVRNIISKPVRMFISWFKFLTRTS